MCTILRFTIDQYDFPIMNNKNAMILLKSDTNFRAGSAAYFETAFSTKFVSYRDKSFSES